MAMTVQRSYVSRSLAPADSAWAISSSWLRATVVVLSAMAVLALPQRAQSQATNYPSMQLPTASVRDYTAAIAGGNGTTLLFQWRERAGTDSHFGFDVGLSDQRSRNLLAFVGVSGGRELLRATSDQPLDLLGTVGLGLALGDGSTSLRLPIGVSVGHTFPLDEGMSITPYVHPRVSLDVCGSCGRGEDSRSDVSINFDLGANFQVNRQFALRVAAVFSGSDQLVGGEAFAVGFNWTPAALSRSR